MRTIEEKYATHFRTLRKSMGLTQEQFLKRFNQKYNRSFTAPAISQYENGKRIPEIDALMDFADFFSVSIDYLLGNSEFKNFQNSEQLIDQPLTEQEKTLLTVFRETTEEGRMEMIAAIINIKKAIEAKRTASSDSALA